MLRKYIFIRRRAQTREYKHSMSAPNSMYIASSWTGLCGSVSFLISPSGLARFSTSVQWWLLNHLDLFCRHRFLTAWQVYSLWFCVLLFSSLFLTKATWFPIHHILPNYSPSGRWVSILLHHLLNSGNVHSCRALSLLGHVTLLENLMSNHSFIFISKTKLHSTVLRIHRPVQFAESLLLQREQCFTNY